MKWTPEAENAVKKVPFFVRKRVKSRVEKEASEAGKNIITLAEVKSTQVRYLSNMETDIKGYQIDICFGPNGCANRAMEGEPLLEQLTLLLKRADLLSFLKERVTGKLKFHHEIRITLAECPNACSQPQIKDIGIIGACLPEITKEPCSGCGDCVAVCKEKAVIFGEDNSMPLLDDNACLACGQCIEPCPTGTISVGQRGYRVLLGGKLGRHPRLARPLPGIYSQTEALDIVAYCIDFYKNHSLHGERFAEIFTDSAFEELSIYLEQKSSRADLKK